MVGYEHTSEVNKTIHELEGYDEMMAKIAGGLSPKHRVAGLSPEERVAGLSPDERVAGLSPEEVLLTMPDAFLRVLPEEALRILSPEAREQIRKRVGG